MPIRSVAFGSFAWAVLVTVAPAWAQASPPSALPTTEEAAVSKRSPQVAPAPIQAGVDDEGERARAILDALASREHTLRVRSAYGGIIAGATTLGLGVIVETQSERSAGPWLWILGGSLALHGVTALALRGPMESLAMHAEAQSDAALREGWGAAARAARSDRLFGGWTSIGLGTCAAIAGTSFAAGAGDMSSQARTGWSAGLLVGGGVMAGVGILTLLIRSPAEDGYQAAYGSEAPPLSLGVAPLPGGGAVNASGRF